MAGSFFCEECGTGRASINVITVSTAMGEMDVQVCDDCLASWTGTVIGPCTECGDIYARHSRRTESDPWTCEGCAQARPLAAAA